MLLSPSQRIKLIKHIAERLSGESWSIIDLTLKQFSLPTASVFEGSTASYVIEMSQQGSDQVLVDLAQHVGAIFEAAAASHIEPQFWKEGYFRLFISHLSSQREWASDLHRALSPYGISGFVAHRDITPTTEWQDEIELALATCDVLVALLHPKFHESKWTDQEIGFAMGRGVPVFAVKLGEDPYGFIGKFQAFNGMHSEPHELAEELFDVCRKHKQTKGAMSQSLVTLFEKSISFAEAKARIEYLEEMDSWEPSFSQRVKKAVEENHQIREAWDVPRRVHALVEKWSSS